MRWRINSRLPKSISVVGRASLAKQIYLPALISSKSTKSEKSAVFATLHPDGADQSIILFHSSSIATSDTLTISMAVQQQRIRQISVVPAGRAFLIHQLRKIQFSNETREADNEEKLNNNNTNKNKGSKTKQQKKNNKKSKKNQSNQDIEVTIDWDCDLDDYYALLGIKKYEMNISQDNLKKACMFGNNTHYTQHIHTYIIFHISTVLFVAWNATFFVFSVC